MFLKQKLIFKSGFPWDYLATPAYSHSQLELSSHRLLWTRHVQCAEHIPKQCQQPARRPHTVTVKETVQSSSGL